MSDQAPANWYPDPFGRYEVRYWSGERWTEHVTSQGRQGVDPLSPSPALPADRTAKQVRRDVGSVGIAAGAERGGGTIFTESVLVVSQKARLFEVNAEYSVYDRDGRPIGAVREIGQNTLKKMVRADQYSSRRLQILDLNGEVLLTLTVPVALIKARIVVRYPDGKEAGQIVQKWISVLGKASFALESKGEALGSINGEDRDSWDFNIQDADGDEVARINKTMAGLAKELFTKSDNYVVTINRPLEDPLRSMVIASALAVDTVLRQERPRLRL